MYDGLKQTETMNPSTEHGSTVKADDVEERLNHLCGIRLLKTCKAQHVLIYRMLKLIIANAIKFCTLL